jgi:hypothetical protein
VVPPTTRGLRGPLPGVDVGVIGVPLGKFGLLGPLPGVDVGVIGVPLGKFGLRGPLPGLTEVPPTRGLTEGGILLGGLTLVGITDGIEGIDGINPTNVVGCFTLVGAENIDGIDGIDGIETELGETDVIVFFGEYVDLKLKSAGISRGGG